MKTMVDPKVAAGGIAGAMAAILIWAWNTFLPDYPIPAEEAATIAALISFIAGYVKRGRPLEPRGDTR